MSELPLLEASRRLRKPPGRPKKPKAAPVVGDGAEAPQAPGRSSAPVLARESERAVAEPWPNPGQDPGPRLLSLEATAAYLSVSPWTVRSWWAAGMLHAVKPVLASGKSFRRLLFDRAELDQLIATWREG